MPRTRRDVWKLGDGWSDTLIWYARGVDALSRRAITDPTSWRYLAAIHGIRSDFWRYYGYLGPNEPNPQDDPLWNQCQHQTWYFLPWHRGYVAAFEAIVRDAIIGLGGPPDWALPYWNYNDTANPKALDLPPAFAEPTLPDGSPNPLKVAARFGAGGDGVVLLDPNDVEFRDALREDDFTGLASGGSPGFGGPETPFSHNGRIAQPPNPSGLLEDSPHNNVHVGIGGFEPDGNRLPGLMSNPDTAALDPIFWIHHANIDRLWEVWLRRTAGPGQAPHANPEEAAWLDGPADGTFRMPRPDGTTFTFSARAMRDTTVPELDYDYEDVSDPLDGESRVAGRMRALGMTAGAGPQAAVTEAAMGEQRNVELIGANDEAVRLEGRSADTSVALDKAVAGKIAASRSAGLSPGGKSAEPDRVFLNLEGIRGENDGVLFDVYVALPSGADPKAHPENRVGTVGLFGVSKASRADAGHGDNGMTKVLEITRVVDALQVDAADPGTLNVRFVPRQELVPADAISIGRVSIYRQGR